MLNAKRTTDTKLFMPGSDVNLIGKGTVIKGDIQSFGDIRIDGKVIGLLTTNARVVVGPAGEVEGDIVCQHADIMGKVTGTIKVEELLCLKDNCVVNGDIYTSQFEMEPSARFNGRCQMEAIDQEMLEPKENGAVNKKLKESVTP